jgi:hypothetical protein
VEVTIPASTPITVRTAPLINGDDDPVGSRFSASLIAPVMVNGQTVLPQGAPALVRLIDKKKAGFFHRSARLKLALAGISVNGRIYPTATNVLELKPGNSPGGSGDSDNSGGDKPKGKKTLVVLPNTALTFTLETPLTVTVSPESMAPAGGR